MTADVEALLPCPWCGAEALLCEEDGPNPPDFTAMCSETDYEKCQVRPFVIEPVRADAIAAWNRRAESPELRALRAVAGKAERTVTWPRNEPAPTPAECQRRLEELRAALRAWEEVRRGP